MMINLFRVLNSISLKRDSSFTFAGMNCDECEDAKWVLTFVITLLLGSGRLTMRLTRLVGDSEKSLLFIRQNG